MKNLINMLVGIRRIIYFGIIITIMYLVIAILTLYLFDIIYFENGSIKFKLLIIGGKPDYDGIASINKAVRTSAIFDGIEDDKRTIKFIKPQIVHDLILIYDVEMENKRFKRYEYPFRKSLIGSFIRDSDNYDYIIGGVVIGMVIGAIVRDEEFIMDLLDDMEMCIKNDVYKWYEL